MDRFLVQVRKDIGYDNIMNKLRYENSVWMDKTSDKDHGEVKPGDELLIYCTSSVPKHSKLLAFSVAVTSVSSDNVTFEVEDPEYFASPLNRDKILELIEQEELPGVFRFCGHQGFNIRKLTPDEAETIIGLLNEKSETENTPSYSIEDIVKDGCFLEESRLEGILGRLQDKKNLILQGPPGTGKTWLAKRLAYALIGRRSKHHVRPFQFHPNLSYEDFVRGWRPNPDGKLDLVDGPFLEAINDAKGDQSAKYVVVIEEINRGNPAQIFGEMLTLLEADKRSPEEALALSYPRNYGERVSIPCNLYVIGTMNVADRSLALVDFALRRRFAFIDLEPTFGQRWRSWVSEQCQIDTAFLTDVEESLKSLNRTIADDSTLGPQFRIGHSVVTPPAGIHVPDPQVWFRHIVETEIEPLLGEYWFDDVGKAQAESARLLQVLES